MDNNETIISNKSYTNKDFNTIYPELLDIVKKLTSKWDPSISNESDPGVVLLKLNAIIGDKNNYNIDKNILETFPVSVTQRRNAWSVFDQQGFKMKWYKSAIGTALISWTGNELDELPNGTSLNIPKFSMICNEDQSIIYSTLHDCTLSKDAAQTNVEVIQGIATEYTINGRKDLTPSDLVNNRLYFNEPMIAENGIFINIVNEADYDEWKAVNILNTEQIDRKIYKFGIDISSELPYIEFSEDAMNILSRGFNVRYIQTLGTQGNIPPKTLNMWYSEITLTLEANANIYSQITLNDTNTSITNISDISGSSDAQTIEDAYEDYKKQVGTFDTLVTIRDFINKILSQDSASNCFVCDRTNDIQSSWKIVTNDLGIQKEKLLVDKNINGKNEINAFDLKIYAFKNIDLNQSFLNKDIYDSSFELQGDHNSALNPNDDIINKLDENKCLSLDYIPLLPEKYLFFKNVYDISCKIIPNQALNENQRKQLSDKISNLLLKTLNSKVINFGEEIFYDDIYDSILESDNRIKSIMLNDLEYKTYAVYYSTELNQFIDVLVSDIPYYAQAVQTDILQIGNNTIKLPYVTEDERLNTLLVTYDKNTYRYYNGKFYSGYTDNNFTYNEIVDNSLQINTAGNTTQASNISYSDKELSINNVTSSTQVKISYLYNPKTKSKEFRDEILAKSILAGKTPLVEKDSPIEFGLDQKSSHYITDVEKVSTSLDLSLDVSNNNGYTLKSNQEVQLYAPNYSDNETKYSSYVKYEYFSITDTNSVNQVPADAEYVLKANERLVLYWTSSEDDVFYTYQVYGKGTIIQPNFELNATETRFGSALVTSSGTLRNTDLQANIEDINTIMTAAQSISIKKINQVELNKSNYYMYWILNKDTNNDRLFNDANKNIELRNYSLSNNIVPYLTAPLIDNSNLSPGVYRLKYNGNTWVYNGTPINLDTFNIELSDEQSNIAASVNYLKETNDTYIPSVTIQENFLNTTTWTIDGSPLRSLGNGILTLHTVLGSSEYFDFTTQSVLWKVQSFAAANGLVYTPGELNQINLKDSISSDQEGRVLDGLIINRSTHVTDMTLTIWFGGYVKKDDYIDVEILNKTEYVLKSDEYFIYVDKSLTQYNILEEGTKLSLTINSNSDSTAIINDWVISQDESINSGSIDQLADYIDLNKWYKFDASHQTLTLTQQKAINLNEGSSIIINYTDENIINSQKQYINSTNTAYTSDETSIDGNVINQYEVALDKIVTGSAEPLPIISDAQVQTLTFKYDNVLNGTGSWARINDDGSYGDYYQLSNDIGIDISDAADTYTFKRIISYSHTTPVYFLDSENNNPTIGYQIIEGSDKVSDYKVQIDKLAYVEGVKELIKQKLNGENLYANVFTFTYDASSQKWNYVSQAIDTYAEAPYNISGSTTDILSDFGISFMKNDEEYTPGSEDGKIEEFQVKLVKWVYEVSKWTEYFSTSTLEHKSLVSNGRIEFKLIPDTQAKNNIGTPFGDFLSIWQGKLYNSDDTLVETFELENLELSAEPDPEFKDSNLKTFSDSLGIRFNSSKNIGCNIGDQIIINLTNKTRVSSNVAVYQPSASITYIRVKPRTTVDVDFNVFKQKTNNTLNTPYVFIWQQTSINNETSLYTTAYGWQLDGNTVDLREYGINYIYGDASRNIINYPIVGDQIVVTRNDITLDTQTYIHLSNEPVNLKNYTVSYQETKDSQWETLPSLLDAELSWSAIARYNISLSPDSPYKISSGTDQLSNAKWKESIKIFGKQNNTCLAEVPSKTDTDTPVNKYILSSVYFEHKGAENINIYSVNDDNSINYPILYVYELNAENMGDVIISNSGYNIAGNATAIETAEFNFRLPKGTYIIPIYVNFDTCYDVNITDQSYPIELIGQDKTIQPLATGVYYAKIKFESDSTDDTKKIIVTFKTTRSSTQCISLLKPIKYTDALTSELIGTDFSRYSIEEIFSLIADYDKENIYNYIYEIPLQYKIENPLKARSFIDPNHIYNANTICKLNNFTVSIADRTR